MVQVERKKDGDSNIINSNERDFLLRKPGSKKAPSTWQNAFYRELGNASARKAEASYFKRNKVESFYSKIKTGKKNRPRTGTRQEGHCILIREQAINKMIS